MIKTNYRIILFPQTIGEVIKCQRADLEQVVLSFDLNTFLFISYITELEYEKQKRSSRQGIDIWFVCPYTKLEGFFDSLYFSTNDKKSIFLRERLEEKKIEFLKRYFITPVFPKSFFLTNLKS